MKVILCVLALVSGAMFAQDSQGPLSHERLQASAAKWKALHWLHTPRLGKPVMKGNILTEDGMLITLRGEAEITTDSVSVNADKAVYHKDTGEIEASGNVQIRIAPSN